MERVRAGDICAVIGVKQTYTGDTLCSGDHPILLDEEMAALRNTPGFSCVTINPPRVGSSSAMLPSARCDGGDLAPPPTPHHRKLPHLLKAGQRVQPRCVFARPKKPCAVKTLG